MFSRFYVLMLLRGKVAPVVGYYSTARHPCHGSGFAIRTPRPRRG
ncbi:MAG: hypothetical protein BLITH_1095 [Brockia lithotrophica]|uniref:Uncharacterized protein n=1 Tax=Brockia lithotrophica TaxID=933949 RepID=A0A2T5G7K1_9BACL|nr:MAG: hypothetical protein BLITH_1095 [Brockia lithotrophica]